MLTSGGAEELGLGPQVKTEIPLDLVMTYVDDDVFYLTSTQRKGSHVPSATNILSHGIT